MKKSLPLSKVYQLIEPGPVVLVSTSYKGKSNIMAMSWHMMIDFEPPIMAIVMSNRNYSFDFLKKSKECVINIPSVKLLSAIVGVGNCSGALIDKFKKFGLTQKNSSVVTVPMIEECFANLECKVIDMNLATKYNMFILEVVKAWMKPAKRRVKTVHHCGKGVFVVDGRVIHLSSRKK